MIIAGTVQIQIGSSQQLCMDVESEHKDCITTGELLTAKITDSGRGRGIISLAYPMLRLCIN